MLEASQLKFSDYEVQAWKNQKGETREIAVDTKTPFRWRLSMATLSQSGPFSLFPGYRRGLVLLDGSGVTLSHGAKRTRELAPLNPYSFSGDLETEAKVMDPCRDFNVLALEKSAKANVYATRLAPGEETQFPVAAAEHFIFCVDGKIELLEPNTGKTFLLSQYDTFRLSRQSEDEFLNIRARAKAPDSAYGLWVVVHLLT